MDYIKKNKFLTAVVALLVLLNIGVVAFVFFFFTPPVVPPGRSPRGERLRFIEERLSLDEAQKGKFQQLREKQFAGMDSLMRRRFQAMRDLHSLLKTENPAPELIQQKASAIGAIETEQSVAMFRHFQELRALLTPEQQKEFDRIVTDAMMQTRGERSGARGPLPPGPGIYGPGHAN